MLLELSELLAKTNNADAIVIDNYTMKDGIYFSLDLNGNIVDELVVNKDTNKYSNLYQWFKVRDYYSKLVDMNKPVDKNKKIHSNNVFTVFIKTDILPGIGKGDKVLSDDDLHKAFGDYFDRLMGEPEKVSKSILDSCNVEEVDPVLSKKCRDILEKGLGLAIERIGDRKGISGYLKLFVISDNDSEQDAANYKREGERYVMPKIFNDNSYNVYIDDELMGLSNENMQLNAKKPFLKLYGTRFAAPYRVSLNQALINKKLFEWMENSLKENGKPNMRFSIPYDYDFQTSPRDDTLARGLFIETETDNGKRKIVNVDNIPVDDTSFKDDFEYTTFFNLKGDENKPFETRKALEACINKVFFKNQMWKLYYNSKYSPEGCSSVVMNAMKVMCIPMKNYFQLGIEIDLGPMLKKITMLIIKDEIRGDNISFYGIKTKMNLRLNLLEYFKKGEEEKMGDIVVKIAARVKTAVLGKGEAYAENDREFYYCVGQLTRYIFDRSEAANKKMSMYTPVLEAKKAGRIKNILKDATVRYSYNINIYDDRYRRLLRMVMGYETNSKPDSDMILCGICDDNIMYTKKEEKK